jgi:hypothetical protein
VAALIFSVLQIFPTGTARRRTSPTTSRRPRGHGGHVRDPGGCAAGHHRLAEHGGGKLESAIEMPGLLSFLTSRRCDERLTGLNDIPEDRWPDSVPLVYYSYHIMVVAGHAAARHGRRRHAVAPEGPAVHLAPDAVDADAGPPVHLRRQHRGLDHGRDRAPAVGGLRPPAQRGRRLARRVGAGRHRTLHAARLRGPLPVSWACSSPC